MVQVNIFHNVSRTEEAAPEGVSAIQLSDGRFTWKSFADTPDECHELVWVFQYEAEYTGDRADPYAILNAAFETFNIGSDELAAQYRGRALRSLSVGDVVVINGDAYACASRGWEPVHRGDMRTLASDQAEVVIRERYQIGPREALTVTVPLAD